MSTKSSSRLDAPARWKLAMAALVIVSLAGTTGWLLYNATVAAACGRCRARSDLGADRRLREPDRRSRSSTASSNRRSASASKARRSSTRSRAATRLRAAAAIKPGARLDEQTARLVALRENLGMVIVGAIESSGAGYHITIRGIGPGADGAVKYTLEDDAPRQGGRAGDRRRARRRAFARRSATPWRRRRTTRSPRRISRRCASMSRAQELLAAGKADAAIPVYLEAAKLDPDFGRAWSGAATAARNLGRREEATTYYENALSKIDRMTDREKLRTRGQYYLFTGNSTKAIEENEALIKRYPSDSVALSNLGFAYFLVRQFAKASEMQARAVALQPNNVPRLNNGALYAMYAGSSTTR